MNIRKKYRKFRYGQCAVLLYHRITHLETDPQLLSVSPENFDRQIQFLKENYHLLTIDEFMSYLSAGENLPENSVVLTFDDGYADNYLEALPVLIKHGAQALFYICTGNLNTANEFWWDELERLLLLPENLPDALNIMNEGEQRLFPTMNPTFRLRAYETLLPFLRESIPSQRKNTIDQIFEWAGRIPPRHSHRSMTFEEVKKLAVSDSAVIGAHTHSHQSLAALSNVEQSDDIAESKKILEQLTGNPVVHFSYPFGTKKDYDLTTMEICEELGFEWVAANYPDTVDVTTDLFQIPRFLVRNWETESFASHMKQFFK